ncbi:phospholipase D, partial [Rickenella mellea]
MADLASVVQTVSEKSEKANSKPHDDALSNGHADVHDSPKPDVELPAEGKPTLRPPRLQKLETMGPIRRSIRDSPSARTGPPRSFSFNIKMSPHASRQNTLDMGSEPIQELEGPDILDHYPKFSRLDSDFRGALEYNDPEQREREREAAERKEKNRQSVMQDSWNPLKWLGMDGVLQSPKEEKRSGFESPEPEETDNENESALEGPSRVGSGATSDHAGPSSRAVSTRGNVTPKHDGAVSPTKRFSMTRSQSFPAKKDTDKSGGAITPRWGRLRSLIPSLVHQAKESSRPGQSAIQPGVVNITDELMVGGLATLMLRLWIDRDERDNRRVPVLLHRLRIRISDSLHPLHGNKAVFRIECEYANGASRWVIYRQLRDFISLHTHYRFSNAFRHDVDALPEFPRTSLPYFKFLQKEGRQKGNEVGKADFAVMQREALENYLIGLIRAVMFHPTSNRLAGFLEISALSISLARSGGWQAKAGFLRIDAASSKTGYFGRKNTPWKEKKKQRWCAVRDSYLVVLQEPGEIVIWDVFLLDSNFKIERPTRYYRQGLSLFHSEHYVDAMDDEKGKGKDQDGLAHSPEHFGTLSRIKEKVAHALHIPHSHHELVPSSVKKIAASASAPPTIANRERSNSAVSATSSSSSSSSRSSVAQIVDPSTNMNPLRPTGEEGDVERGEGGVNDGDEAQKRRKRKEKKQSADVSKHTFFIQNSQMRLKLFARNERQMQQWITAMEKTAATSHWTGGNRFDSFAPIRLNVAAQWLVDGRDYFWNLSRALMLARERVYIHDWWLSPELQMRRPGKPHYRLDKILERKAREGVKIYIILYNEVSNRTTPTDSNYTKQKLLGLHPNIMVQRSPSHFVTGTFYWAHHEKMCVIDEAIAFMGGIDLCFGRWDTPQHVLVDIPEGEGAEKIWPGKDYSNGRVSDFFTLDKPEQDMYDRQKVPRMPWHDVGMQLVGQPARDLCRHFVQRWNHLLRIKNHTRTWPFLLPPPDFKPTELRDQGLTGTCEVQICRSCGPWSMGTPAAIEHSIQNAYLKAIQMSEHFVYIENQFFITSTNVNATQIENQIGDALVHRIIRAHREGTPWKACIVIPLLPGFPFPVDHNDASALRIILECQNRTICRGPDSIFSRLREEDIDPDEYICFFGLRNWAKLPNNVLTTEMVYIHGKVCIVDDRLAIIGSANINERSQRGDRDSELAAVVRDTDMIDGFMAGQPFKVGRFAHTLRVRLMREHLGVDVDGMYEEDLMANTPVKEEYEQEAWDPDQQESKDEKGEFTQAARQHKFKTPTGELLEEVMDSTEQALHGTGEGASKDVGYYLRKAGIKSRGIDSTVTNKELAGERETFGRDGKKEPGFGSSIVPTLEEKTILEHRPPPDQAKGEKPIEDTKEAKDAGGNAEGGDQPQQARVQDGTGELYGAPADASKNPQTDDEPPHARSGNNDATEEEEAAVQARGIIRKHLSVKVGAKPWTLPTPTPEVDPHGFEDPISDKFWKNVWVACGVHNTEIYRKVFHCIPDDMVTTWKQYKEFIQHHERLNKPPKDSNKPDPIARVPSEAGDDQALSEKPGTSNQADEVAKNESENEKPKQSTPNGQDGQTPSSNGQSQEEEQRNRQRTRPDEPFEQWERDEMEQLLKEVRGHLVLYSTRFLEGEDVANNFLFNADRLLPMPIY